MPGIFEIDAGTQPVLFISSGKQFLYEQLAALGMVEKVLKQDLEMRGRHGLVVVPPDRSIGRVVTDNKLVLGGPACVRSRLNGKRAVAGEFSFLPCDRFGDQLFSSIILVMFSRILNREQNFTGRVGSGARHCVHSLTQFNLQMLARCPTMRCPTAKNIPCFPKRSPF